MAPKSMDYQDQWGKSECVSTYSYLPNNWAGHNKQAELYVKNCIKRVVYTIIGQGGNFLQGILTGSVIITA
jgi:hypothetical protein